MNMVSDFNLPTERVLILINNGGLMNKRDEPAEHEYQDIQFMREALAEAKRAAAKGEVPVGAVVAVAGKIVARTHNLRETSGDPTAHAEILALRRAAKAKKHWRLTEATLYVTLEPCPMCTGAMVLARIKRLVYGAADPKAGAAGSLMDLARDTRLNHRIEVTSSVLAVECGKILTDFFKERRN